MIRKILILILFSTFLSSCWEKEVSASTDKPDITPPNKLKVEINDNSQGDKLEIENASSQNKLNGKLESFTVKAGDIILGTPESKVIFIEYFSPTCPHCVTYHKMIFPEIKAKYLDAKKITYVMREFIATKQDLDASLLARCKGDVDNYLKFVDVFLSKQDGWAFDKNYREILTNIGSLGGVSPEKFSECLNDQGKIKILMENTQLANSRPKFPGTPSFFINGELFKGRYTAEELSKAIDKALAE